MMHSSVSLCLEPLMKYILVFDLILTSQWKAENRKKISHFPKKVALNTVMNVVYIRR